MTVFDSMKSKYTRKINCYNLFDLTNQLTTNVLKLFNTVNLLWQVGLTENYKYKHFYQEYFPQCYSQQSKLEMMKTSNRKWDIFYK